MANQYPYNFNIQQYMNPSSIQQIFPQPQGSVYSINSPIELGNVPIGSTGLSVVLCLNEDVMYIKSFQNGAPVVMAYRVSPYQKENQQNVQNNQDKISLLENKINRIEQLLTQSKNDEKKGVKNNGSI